MTTEVKAIVWTGNELGDFLTAHNLSPEQIAHALRRDVLTVRNWIRLNDEKPFAGNENDSVVLRLAIVGLLAESKGTKTIPAAEGPPLEIQVRVNRGTGQVQVGMHQLARPPRVRGTGTKPGPEFVWLPS